jgi:hypothetical protein
MNRQNQWLFEVPFSLQEDYQSRVPQIKRGVGEIKPAGKHSEKRGISQLMGRVAYPGKRVLVTYARARDYVYVRMKILDQYNQGKWIFLGKLNVKDLEQQNLSLSRFGTEVEARVRNLVLKATGKLPTAISKHGNATGPDIVWEYRI